MRKSEDINLVNMNTNSQNTRTRSKSPIVAMGPLKSTINNTNPGPPVVVAAPQIVG